MSKQILKLRREGRNHKRYDASDQQCSALQDGNSSLNPWFVFRVKKGIAFKWPKCSRLHPSCGGQKTNGHCKGWTVARRDQNFWFKAMTARILLAMF
jgi:hypothetical protein